MPLMVLDQVYKFQMIILRKLKLLKRNLKMYIFQQIKGFKLRMEKENLAFFFYFH